MLFRSSDDPVLRDQANVGAWFAMTELLEPIDSLEAAMAAVPDDARLSWRDEQMPAAAVKQVMRGLLPASAVELPALKELRLHVGPVADEGMKAISTLVGLEILELGRFTPGADKATQHIAKLTKLKSLDLSASDLTDAGLKQLEGLKNLTELKIGFTKTTPAGQAAFKKAVPNAKIITFITTGP